MKRADVSCSLFSFVGLQSRNRLLVFETVRFCTECRTPLRRDVESVLPRNVAGGGEARHG